MITDCIDEYGLIDYDKVCQYIEGFNGPRRCFITVDTAPNDKKNWIYERYIRFVRFKTPLSERKKHNFNKNHWREQYNGK